MTAEALAVAEPVPQSNGALSRFVWRMTAALMVAFAMLTAADIATTLYALAGGGAIELNPNAARDGGGIRVGFVIFANVLLALPLLIAFAIGISNASRVPPSVLARWWRHIFDIFYISPLNDRARARSPLRLVTAAMTLLMLKLVILVSNSLVVLGYNNPTSILAAMLTKLGVTGPERYWSAYALIIMPCYIGGVGLAATMLGSAQQQIRLRIMPRE